MTKSKNYSGQESRNQHLLKGIIQLKKKKNQKPTVVQEAFCLITNYILD